MPIQDYLTSGKYPYSMEGVGPTSQSASRLMMMFLQGAGVGAEKRQKETDAMAKLLAVKQKQEYESGEKAKEREFGMEKLKMNLHARVYGDWLGALYDEGGLDAVIDAVENIKDPSGAIWDIPKHRGGGTTEFYLPTPETRRKVEEEKKRKEGLDLLKAQPKPKTFSISSVMPSIIRTQDDIMGFTEAIDFTFDKINELKPGESIEIGEETYSREKLIEKRKRLEFDLDSKLRTMGSLEKRENEYNAQRNLPPRILADMDKSLAVFLINHPKGDKYFSSLIQSELKNVRENPLQYLRYFGEYPKHPSDIESRVDTTTSDTLTDYLTRTPKTPTGATGDLESLWKETHR